MIISLILVKDGKTQYKLLNTSMYEVGQVTSNGWLVIDKRFYCNMKFLTYSELKNEYWKLFNEKLKKSRNKRIKGIFNIFKKW